MLVVGHNCGPWFLFYYKVSIISLRAFMCGFYSNSTGVSLLVKVGVPALLGKVSLYSPKKKRRLNNLRDWVFLIVRIEAR